MPRDHPGNNHTGIKPVWTTNRQEIMFRKNVSRFNKWPICCCMERKFSPLFNHVQQSPKAHGWHEFAFALLNNSLCCWHHPWSPCDPPEEQLYRRKILERCYNFYDHWSQTSYCLTTDVKNPTWTLPGNEHIPTQSFRDVSLRSNSFSKQKKNL